MCKRHRAFVFDEAGYRRELAPLLDRNDSAGLTRFIAEHQEQLRNPETGALLEEGDELNPVAVALTAFYDPRANIGLGSAAQTLRFSLIDLYPEGRVFVQGGLLGVPEGYFQSAEYVAGSVEILERLREDYPRKRDIIEPVLTMLRTAAKAGKGLYITP